MKALALVLGATCVVCANVEAQTFVGLRAGTNHATHRDEWGATGRLPGVNVGLATLRDVTPWIALEADVQFSQKGWRDGDMFIGRDYLELPGLIRVGIPRSDIDDEPKTGLHPFMLGGLAPAIRLTCYEANVNRNAPETGSPPAMEFRFPRDCRSYSYPFDFGLLYGAGLTLRRSRQQFSVEIRRTVGLMNVLYGPPYSCNCRSTNDVFSVSGGMSVRVR